MVPDDEAGQMRKCETCGEMLRVPREAPDAVLAALSEGEPVAPAPEFTECPRCGNAVRADGIRCPACGYDFSREEWPHAEPAVQPTGGPAPRECPTYAWMAWLARVLTAAGIILMCISTIEFLYGLAQWIGRFDGAFAGFQGITGLALCLNAVYGVVYGFLIVGVAQALAALRHIAINVWTLTRRAVAQPPAAPDQK